MKAILGHVIAYTYQSPEEDAHERGHLSADVKSMTRTYGLGNDLRETVYKDKKNVFRLA